MKISTVILAGGGGTRFWPLSRQNMPKQLLNISGNDVMINETISRCEGLVSPLDTFVITNKSQTELLKQILIPEVPTENILIEPFARNTSACILYSALMLKKRFGDCIMVVLPSDHYISDADGFRSTLYRACQVASESDKLITIGIKPTFPSTGYGYISYNPQITSNFNGAYEVQEFVEKPDFKRAKHYFESGNYMWNSGMFVWKVSSIIDNFKRFLPRIFSNFTDFEYSMGTEKEKQCLENVYKHVQSISIDYGIMERSDDVLVVPGDFGWNDVGSWDALGSIFPTDDCGNIVKAKHAGINTKNSIIFSNDRLITTIDIDNLIIADSGDAILICPKDKAQDVKKIVDLLKEKDMNEYI